MKALKKLDRKLNWYQKIRKKLMILGLTAGLLAPAGVFGVPFLMDANNKWEQQRELQQLVEEPVPESFIADVKKKSIDFYVGNTYDFDIKDGICSYCDTGEYSKYEDTIRSVAEKTDVPAYILAGLVDYCSQCSSSPGAPPWFARTPITPEEAGLDGMILWEDIEQDFLSAAGKFRRIFREVNDEAAAIVLMYAGEDHVKKAKKEAVEAYARLKEYSEWRSKRSAEDLARYDALVEQRNALPLNDWEKKSELEDQLKALFDEITDEKSTAGGDVRGSWDAGNRTWHPDLFNVTVQPNYWTYKSWWVNNVTMGCSAVKTALRLKRDGYK